jgi:hypothetical protein
VGGRLFQTRKNEHMNKVRMTKKDLEQGNESATDEWEKRIVAWHAKIMVRESM